MAKNLTTAMLFTLSFIMSPVQSYALDDELKVGQDIFLQQCAGCHGPQGNGDGEIAELFKVKPGALSKLSSENGGEFPFELVYQTLKATEKVKGHGQTAMPIWGYYFNVEVLTDPGVEEREAFITLGKMLSVIYYIETLQEK